MLPIGCGRSAAVQDVTYTQWIDLVEDRASPNVVYVWATWSRESVELLPTILELQQEYEELGVGFLFLSLDVDYPAEALGVMRELNGPAFYRITTSLEEASAALGISEPPAMLGYGSGDLELVLAGETLSPDRAADLLESLLAENL